MGFWRVAYRDKNQPLGSTDRHCRHKHTSEPGDNTPCMARIRKGAVAAWAVKIDGRAA